MSGIRRVRLRNVRRFVDATFEFAAGTTFLEGENNAGKTTVFYAIEYALFGRAGTVLGANELMRPAARGMGVELCFTGRDKRDYRLQRVHLRPPRSRTKVVGHFTLWVSESEPDAQERYLLSSDFDDLETDLAVVLEGALGVSRRGWDLAMHHRQGRIADILDGGPELDIVLGVTAAVMVEEEIRAMALEREKAARELSAAAVMRDGLDSELARLEQLRLELVQAQREASPAPQPGSDADEPAAPLATVSHLQGVADRLDAAERAWELADGTRSARQEALDELTELGPPQPAEGSELDALEAELEALHAAKREEEQRLRALERGRGDVHGQLQRLRRAEGTCDQCGQPVDAEHLAERLPALERSLSQTEAQVASCTERMAGLASRLDQTAARCTTLRERIRDQEMVQQRMTAAKRALGDAEARVSAAARDLATARTDARMHVQAEDQSLLAQLSAHIGQIHDKVRAAEARRIAEQEHAASRLAKLDEQHKALEQEIAERTRERATADESVRRLTLASTQATRLRGLAKAFKLVQQDVREQATAALAQRTLELHQHLSGTDDEVTALVVDPARYVIHVTPADVGRHVVASLAQGGGHRLLLGLAMRLALAEHLGPLPFLLLDEPTYGLDGPRREALLDRIAQLRVAEQLLLITHHVVNPTDAHRVSIERVGEISRLRPT